MSKTISVTLFGNNALHQEQLTDFLNSQDAFQVTSIAKNSHELLSNLALSLVDVVIINLVSPILKTIETVKSIREKYGLEIKIIVSNMTHHLGVVEEFKKAGASVLLDNSASSENLVDVLLGRYTLESFFACNGLSEFDNPFRLTQREMLICELLCKGNSCPEIASSLFNSIRTIENHKASIFKKMEVGSCTKMMEKAIIGGYYVI